MTTFNWQGREDQEEAEDTRRFYNQIITTNPQEADYGLVGFACDLGVSANLGRVGAKDAPDAIRTQLTNLAWHGGNKTLYDFGNIEVEQDLNQAQSRMRDKIISALSQVKERVLVLGGGHETAFTSLSALYQHYFANHSQSTLPKLGIINFDAHFDLRQPSIRGASSGTPFYQAKQLFKENFHYCCLGVSSESNTHALFKRAKEYQVAYLLDAQINSQPISKTQTYIEHFCKDKSLLYISIDMDVLPHYQAPGVSAPAVRGVCLERLEILLETIQKYSKANNIKIKLIEISELNPIYDKQDMTAKTAAIIANRLLVEDSSITFSY